MADIRIVTDSTAGLPEELISARNIKVVPLMVNFDTESFREGVDLDNADFYRRLKASEKLPTTSQPAVGDFKRAYEELAAAGAGAIISIHIAEGISGTVQSAQTAAAELPELNIKVINSRLAGMGLAMAVLVAADEIAAGKDVDAVVRSVVELAAKVKLYFVVDTLEYLHKGGRIGGAKALMGSVLNIKPILGLENVIEPVDKARGRTKAIARLVEIAVKDLGGKTCRYALTHAQDEEGVKELQQAFVAAVKCEGAPLITPVSPVIGAHVGPGTVGLAYYAV
ncbi:MAG: DegV family protein [Candidatus Geothermincolia bacterium]